MSTRPSPESPVSDQAVSDQAVSEPTRPRAAEPADRRGMRAAMVRGLSYGAIMRVAGMGLSFLVGWQLARGLGVEGFGVYGLATSTVALLSIASEFGVPFVVTREVAVGVERQEWGRVAGVIRWADRAVLLLSGIVFVVGAVMLTLPMWLGDGAAADDATGPTYRRTLLVALLVVPILGLAKNRFFALRGLMFIGLGQLNELLIRPGLLAALLGAFSLAGWLGWVATDLTPPIAMAFQVVAVAIGLVVGTLLLRGRRPREADGIAPLIETGAWSRAAAPMGLSSGIRVLQQHALTLVLGAIGSAAAVGLFQCASRVGVVATMPLNLMAIVVGPAFARLHAGGDRDRIQRLAARASWAMFGGTLLMLLPFAFVGRTLFATVFDDDFADANATLLVLGAAHLFTAATGASSVLLNMTGHERDVARAGLLSCLGSIAAAALLIPPYQEMGAAVAYGVGSVIWKGLLWRAARRRTGIDPSLFGAVLPPPRQPD